MNPATALFYFSLRSPYSWLAWRDLRDHHPAQLATLELAPFWEPDAEHAALLEREGESFLYAPMSRQKHLYILSDVRTLAAQRGLTIKWPVDTTARWEIAHHGYFIALSHGRQLEYIDAVCDSRWRLGLDICTPEVIGAIADRIGLPVESTALAYLNPDVRSLGLAALRRCVKDGVFGVPFFVSKREKFWGLDRLPQFLAARRSVLQTGVAPELEAAARLPAHPAMFDHAGGCG